MQDAAVGEVSALASFPSQENILHMLDVGVTPPGVWLIYPLFETLLGRRRREPKIVTEEI